MPQSSLRDGGAFAVLDRGLKSHGYRHRSLRDITQIWIGVYGGEKMRRFMITNSY
jgi:hypothetical protein